MALPAHRPARGARLPVLVPGSPSPPHPPAERLVQVMSVDGRGEALSAALEAHGYAVRRSGTDVAAAAAQPAPHARVLVWHEGLGDAAACAAALRRADPRGTPLVLAVPVPLAGAWSDGVHAVAADDAAGLVDAVDRAVAPLSLDVPPQAFLDALDDAVALVDDGGRLRWTNRAFDSLFQLDGSGDREPLSALLPGLRRPLDAEAATEWMATAAVRRDRSRFDVDLRITPITATRAMVIVRDAAPRRLAELTERANTDLREQIQRTQRIGALGRLAGGLAHDFNNLLQVISGYAETLGGERLDPAGRRRLLARIKGATERAASLTRQLLAFGRRQVLMPEVLDLNQTVQSLQHLLQRVIGEDIQVTSVLAPDLGRVKVDPGQVEQVLLNLALNARDAMQQGGALEFVTANLELQAPWTPPGLPAPVPAGRWVLITVRDTGSGMDADTIAQAFEPFFTTKDPSRGSGLGLSMVHGIVKQSGGHTWIESTPGVGTSVHVLLPAWVETAADRATAAPVPAAPPAPQPGTVLLVEDDPEVRALFATFLRQAGHTVVEAADGREALAAFDARGGAFDLVVSDVVMPHVSGPSLVRALRARRESLKVLFLSGYNDPFGTVQAEAHLHKPVSRAALLGQVADLLQPPPGSGDHNGHAAQAAG
jgi:signal transduction histidine kinase/CheY-like chemotaxis protein